MNLEDIMYAAAFVEGSWAISKLLITAGPNFEFPPESDKEANKRINRFIMLPGPLDVIYLKCANYAAKRYDKNNSAP